MRENALKRISQKLSTLGITVRDEDQSNIGVFMSSGHKGAVLLFSLKVFEHEAAERTNRFCKSDSVRLCL